MAALTLNDWLTKSSIVKEAYIFAKKVHHGQKRKTDEPYFNHCIATAEGVAEWKLDEQTVAAALLHDVVEDAGVGLGEIKEKFGEEIAFLVDGVTKVGHVKYRGTELEVENLRKFILYLSKDMRVFLIKLADRIHNMKTLYALAPDKQKRIALESMEVYAPLAYRLGMQKISGELEDLAFPYLYPEEYKWLLENVKEHYLEREKYLARITPKVEKNLNENGVDNFEIKYRAKRYTSLYKKLLRYDMDINSIYDLVALRLVTDTIENCYRILGVVHQYFQPLPHRFKDYIALPKPNGYKSLHTTVFAPENKIIEIQIKTQQMHEDAEYGIAAHFAYAASKGTKAYNKRRASFVDLKELAWVNQLQEWQKKFSDSENFVEALKIDFFRDRIFVISPKGDVFDLPVGAMPLDYAFNVHTDIGAHCAGAKINGKIVPLDYKLKSGDLVEIITQKNKKPSGNWLDLVFTNEAKKKIKSFIGMNKNAKKDYPADKNSQINISLCAQDRDGLISDVTNIISTFKVNIDSLKTQSIKHSNLMKILIVSKNANREKVVKLLRRIRMIHGIKDVNCQGC